MGKLFGTDGIRGLADSFLTPEFADKTATAIISAMKKLHITEDNFKILIGEDTRESSSKLSMAMAKSFQKSGADVYLLGVAPTPAVAMLTKSKHFDLGVMISASHNLFQYNGIKISDKNGHKLSDEIELCIEDFIFNGNITDEKSAQTGTITHSPELLDDYCTYIKNSKNMKIKKAKIVLDCANGSAVATVHKIFKDISNDIIVINNEPNGKNINDKCGSTELDSLIKTIKDEKADFGFAFDGDADRCLCVDRFGGIIDGDHMIAAVAKYYKYNNQLKNNAIAVTKLSNMALEKYLAEHDIKVYYSTEYGDRYVSEKMAEKNLVIGGERAGHIILSDKLETGDGQLTALTLLSAMSDLADFDKILSSYVDFPQISINLTATEKQKDLIKSNIELKDFIEENSKKNNLRCIVRPSGTEPLVRILVEAADEQNAKDTAEILADRCLEIFRRQ